MTMLHFDCQHEYASGFKLNFSFETHAAITAIVGPSGSGKTTVLRLISGLLKPKTGVIKLDERVLFDSDSNVSLKPEQRHVGALFQEQALFPHMTVRSNLEFGKRRRPAGSIAMEDVTEVLELGDLLSRFPSEISGGQQQRVALGRAVLSNPRILLLDEPLNAVEPELRDRILEYLKKALDAFQIPALLVSHNETVVSQLSGRTIRITAGALVE